MNNNIYVKMTDFLAVKKGEQQTISFSANDYFARRFGTLGLTTRGVPSGTISPVTLVAISYDDNNNRITHHMKVKAALLLSKGDTTHKKYILKIHAVDSNDEPADNKKAPSISELISFLSQLATEYREGCMSETTFKKKLVEAVEPLTKGK